MRRALFAVGLTLALGGAGFLGYALYAKALTDLLLHILAGMIALGACIACLMADPKTLLALLDRALAFRKPPA